MNLRQLLAWLLAVAVPAAAIYFATPPERAATGLIVAPFALPSLLLVHVLAALPLAHWLAGRSREWFVAPGASFLAGPCIVGLVVAAIAYFQIETIAEALGASFALRCGIRSLLVILLAWPWCWLSQEGERSPRWFGVVAAAAAFGAPAIHSDARAEKHLRFGSEAVWESRLIESRPHWIIAGDLAPARPAPNFKKPTTAPQALKMVDDEITDLTRKLERIKPQPGQLFDYAEALLSLNRNDEADAALAKLPQEGAVLLRRAEIDRRRGDFDSANTRLRSATESEKTELSKTAFEQLAKLAVERHDPAGVERVLTEARAKLPQFAGDWELHLARHYSQTGRPLAALDALDRAEADGKLKNQIDPMRRTIREQTPGCLLR